jgi:SAM-dependent methyltransferase
VSATQTRRARRRAALQWERNPAGTTLVSAEEGSSQFFEQMTVTRYREQPWHPQLLSDFDPRGRLLEIGCGAGTDHSELASSAARTVAVDLAQKGARLTKQRLSLEGADMLSAVADGEHLPFPDGAFDEIYSFGVIHHTDHPGQVAREMYRVLRPGGRFLVGIYHRWSVFTLLKLGDYLLKGRWRTETWQAHLARMEAGADEVDPAQRPAIRLYSRRSAKRLFRQFEGLRTRVVHDAVGERPVGGPLSPVLRALRRPGVVRRFGWYVVVEGAKGP